MSGLPVARGGKVGTSIPKVVGTSIPKPSLSQIATATGSQLDLYAGRTKPTMDTVAPPTETFLEGDRVWVGGTKQGTVRYIGETKFAPGEWAGVELDEAQGKNDGSVGGVVYFSCPSQHGVFSRCNRLSRKQSVVSAETTVTTLRRMSRAGGSASPSASTMDLINRSSCSPPLSPAESTSSLAGVPLQVGDRVIVASSMAGTKTGTLRYLGPTDFAKGEWVGVELDAAIGKNDGMVDGKRYFTCDANFGLFAPLHKVTKSPKMRMMKPSAITPIKLRRESSTLSEVSTASVSRRDSFVTPAKKMSTSGVGLVTPATVKSNTTALKEQLREKEAHIEQLLRERDMERAEVGKAASQTDEAETKLAELRQEFENWKMMSGPSPEELQQIRDQLEEERRKSEDLQFRLEEEEILRSEGSKSSTEVEENMKSLRAKIISLEEGILEIKEEKEAVGKQLTEEKGKHEELQEVVSNLRESEKEKVVLQDKLTILNKELISEQKRCENFEVEANKVFEAEEQLMIVNEELATAKKKLEETESDLEREVKMKEGLLSGQKDQDVSVSEKIIQFENESKAKETEIMELKHEVEKLKSTTDDSESKYSSSVSELNSLKKSLQELSSESEKQKRDIIEKENEISSMEVKVKELREFESKSEADRQTELIKMQELESSLSSKEKEIVYLKEQIDQSGSDSQKEVQLKLEEIETLNVKMVTKDTEIDGLKSVLNSKEENLLELRSNLSVSEKNITALTELKKNLEKESGALKDSAMTAASEVERVTEVSSKKDEDIMVQNQNIKSLSGQNENLANQLQDLERGHQTKLEELGLNYDNQLAIFNKSSEQFEKDLEASRKELSDSKNKYDFLQKQTTETHQAAFSKITKTIESKDERINELEEKVNTLREDSVNKDSNSESTLNELKQLEGKLKSTTELLEKEKADLETKLGEKANQLEQLDNKKKSLEADMENFKWFEVKFNEASIEKDELDNRNRTLKEEKTGLENQIKDLVSNSSDSNAQLDKLNEENSRLSEELSSLKDVTSESKQKVLKLQNELDKLRSSSAKEIEELRNESSEEVSKLSEQIELTNKENEEAINAKNEFIHNLNETLDTLRKSMNEMKAEKEKSSISSDSEITKLNSEVVNLNDKIAGKDERLENLQWTNEDLERQLERLKEEHEEEMGEMVDVVNDLKIKEDELGAVERDLKVKTNKIDELCKQLLQQEHSHKDLIKKKDAQLEDEMKIVTVKIEEAKSQAVFLKDQMGSMKVENDLQIQKRKSEHEVELNQTIGLLDQKTALVAKLKEDLTNREEELEFTKEELQNKKEELEDISSDLDIKEASFSNETKEVEERHKEEVEELITKNEGLNAGIGQLKETIAKQTADFDSKMDESVKNKKEEVNSLRDQLSEKEMAAMDLQANIKSMEDEMHNLKSTMDGEATLASAKIEKISVENETLRRTKYELENSVKNAILEKDHIINVNEDLSIRIVEFEVQVKEMKSQYESLQVEHRKQSYELKTQTEKASLDSSSLEELQQLLNKERIRVDEMQVGFNDLEAERDQLSRSVNELEEQAREIEKVKERNTALNKEVTDLTRKNEFLFEEIAKERLKLESKIEILAEALEEKNKECSIKEFEVSQLQSENCQLSSYKRQVLTLEQEKRDLEGQLAQVAAEARMMSQKPTTNHNPVSLLTNHNTGEETEEDQLKMQVEFLNSVIVDMQRKTDEMKAKMELYETAGILDESVDFMFNGVSSRAVPPRMFCDICDEFDRHDTEDCPTQAMPVYVEDVKLENSHTKAKGKRGVERPYCDVCEVFGHTSDQCDEQETF